MTLALTPHPATPCAAIDTITANATRGANGALDLRFVVTGDITALRLPSTGPSARADGLWKHTCFEAFVRAPGAAGYVELNVSPSTQWAAYAFDGYRIGMRNAEIAPPRLVALSSASQFELLADFALPELEPARQWTIALTAVIEDAGGALSYWALAHPPGKPDFHHPDSFAHTMERA